MASKRFSSTKFWLTQFGLAGLLIAIGAAVIVMRQEGKNERRPEGASEERSIASGLTEFYREFRMSSSKFIREPKGDFVIPVAKDNRPLETRLKAMSSDLKPVSSGWVGEHKFRTFQAGNSLRSALSQYAEQEGMQVVWDLHEDFVVKHQFQMEDTIVGATAEIAKAIDSNFDGDVRGYFCPKQRSLVITVSETEYLARQCRLAR